MFDGFWWILMGYVWGARSGECSYKVYTLCFQTYIYKMKHALSPSKYGPFFILYEQNFSHVFKILEVMFKLRQNGGP